MQQLDLLLNYSQVLCQYFGPSLHFTTVVHKWEQVTLDCVHPSWQMIQVMKCSIDFHIVVTREDWWHVHDCQFPAKRQYFVHKCLYAWVYHGKIQLFIS